jgi:hypothetical protein
MAGFWRSLVLTGFVVVAFAAPALAQAEEGDKEVLLNGDITASFGGEADPITGVEPGSATTGNVAAGLGYYFTQAMQGSAASISDSVATGRLVRPSTRASRSRSGTTSSGWGVRRSRMWASSTR